MPENIVELRHGCHSQTSPSIWEAPRVVVFCNRTGFGRRS